MNVILLLIDSLNRHDLEPYGSRRVKTPNLKDFSARATTMTRHFAGSLPCMPARREIYAGVREFPWRGWGHVEAFDTLLPERATAIGYTTKLITDHYHFFQWGSFGFFECFDGYDFIRGQETDTWKTERPAVTPEWVARINEFRPGWGSKYYGNTAGFWSEDDWFTPRVFRTAQDWLRANHANPFFLFIDHFEVHEPFHCVEPYRSLYTDDLDTVYNIWPPYQNEEACRRFFEQTGEAELAFLRSQYWGKISWVDKYLGDLLQTMDELRIWDDTVFIITTDHGHDLATWRPMFGKQAPHHDSHIHLPLIIWHPAAPAGSRLDTLTSTVDLHATIREILGDPRRDYRASTSFLQALVDGKPSPRAGTICGTYGTGAVAIDEHYTYVHQPSGPADDLYSYSGYLPRESGPRWCSTATCGKFIPSVEYPVWRMRAPDGTAQRSSADHRLYKHSETDPSSEENRIVSEPETAARMRSLLTDQLRHDGCPPEQFVRLGLDA